MPLFEILGGDGGNHFELLWEYRCSVWIDQKDRQQRVGDKEFVADLPRGLSLFRNNSRCPNPRQSFGVLRGGRETEASKKLNE